MRRMRRGTAKDEHIRFNFPRLTSDLSLILMRMRITVIERWKTMMRMKMMQVMPRMHQLLCSKSIWGWWWRSGCEDEEFFYQRRGWWWCRWWVGCTNFPRFTSDWCSLAPKYKLIKTQPATWNDERANLPFWLTIIAVTMLYSGW